MGKPHIVLMDPDATYLAPLESRFLEELKDDIDLEVITDEQYRNQFLSTPHDIEALLVSEEWHSDSLAMQNIAHTFVLTEERQVEGTSSLLVDYTFKYSSINLIFGKVKSSCAALSMKDEGKEAQVVMFHSPVGGSGSTTAAMAMSVCLQEAYKRVLYVDAEYIQTFRCFMQSSRLAPDRMAQEMADPCGALFERMSAYIESNGFDYLPPLRAGLVAFGVDFGFFARFVEAVRDSGRYDYVVVDTDSTFDENKIELLSLADKVVVVVTQDAKALFKTARFIENLDSADEEKYMFICNKYRKGEDNAFADTSGGSSVSLDGYVEYDRGMTAMDALALAGVDGFKRLANTFI